MSLRRSEVRGDNKDQNMSGLKLSYHIGCLYTTKSQKHLNQKKSDIYGLRIWFSRLVSLFRKNKDHISDPCFIMRGNIKAGLAMWQIKANTL